MKRRKKTANNSPQKAKESKCRTCTNCIFDEQWGEYKCKARETRLYNLAEIYECAEYEKRKP